MRKDLKDDPTLPLYNWCQARTMGVLCHLSCFPSETGIGNMGAGAYRFLDFLADTGMKTWQLCPLGPTGYGDSPYQSFSAFAGNPYFIDWAPLMEAGLVNELEMAGLLELPRDRVDFGRLYEKFWPLLKKAAKRFRERGLERIADYEPFEVFCGEHESWLKPYSWYRTLKTAYAGAPWWEFPQKYRTYPKAAKAGLPAAADKDQLADESFYQYIFFQQWQRLRAYANRLGIEVIGDLPIFVAMDSADAWGNPGIFQMDTSTGEPEAVAGVPPDYFSEDGQLWGNPLFDWEYLKKTDYAWWMQRLEASFRDFDIVRIDHFRGFHDYWSVPAGSANARNGTWKPGPGLEFFRKVRERFPEARIIAEDLGEPSPGVVELREACGFPGMAVLQFAFNPGQDSDFLPHNHQANLALYPGTHDNDTTVGWYQQAGRAERDFVRRYLSVSGEEIGWDFIRSCYRSVAGIAVAPIQDFMSLGSEARFNSPGTTRGNWQWRFRSDELESLWTSSKAYLKELAWLYRR